MSRSSQLGCIFSVMEHIHQKFTFASLECLVESCHDFAGWFAALLYFVASLKVVTTLLFPMATVFLVAWLPPALQTVAYFRVAQPVARGPKVARKLNFRCPR